MSTVQPPPTIQGNAAGDDGTSALLANQQISGADIQARVLAMGGASQQGARPVYWGPWQGNRRWGSPGEVWEPPDVTSDFYSQVPAAGQAYAMTPPPEKMFRPSADYYSQVPQRAMPIGGTTGTTEGLANLDSAPWNTVAGAQAYMRDILASNPEEFYRIGDVMYDLGYFGNETGYDQWQVLEKWDELAVVAADYAGKGDGKVPLTMNQVMYLYSKRLAGNGISDIAGSSSGRDRLLPTRDVQTDTVIYSDSEAKGAFRDLAQRELGKDLSARDLSRLTAMLQGAQAATPRRTVTTVTPTGEGETRTTNRVRGGLDAETWITDRLREDPNYAEHQAAAVYAPALFAALGGYDVTVTAPESLDVVPSIEDDSPLVGTDKFSAPAPDEFQATAESVETPGVGPTDQFGPFDQPAAPTGSSSASFKGAAPGSDVEDIAASWLGTPYVYGGNGRSGIDCSGFTRAVYKEAFGIDLPRISYQQANAGKRVSFQDAQAGDLIAWDNSSRNNGADHIAIYLGNGWIIESPRPGLKVRKRRLDMNGYDRQAWAVHYKERD